MEDVLVKEVVARLLCSSEVAFTLLLKNGWNVQIAILEGSQNLDHRVDTTADYLLVNKCIENGFCGNDTLSSFPDVSEENETFLRIVEREITEKSMKRSLEESKHLNWWIPYIGAPHRLLPIATIGDGNCLLHAVSLAMFGVTDRLVILRKLLHEFCNNHPSMDAIQRRWRLSVAHINSQTNLIFSEPEWNNEWMSVTSATTIEKVGFPESRYIGLEDIHIFILAHLIKRPIVVLAQDYIKNSKNEYLAPLNFAGIYIPFECPLEELSKCPIILGFHTGHFAPLVYTNTYVNQVELITYLLPTVNHNGDLLPLKFYIDPGSFNCSSMVAENIYDIDKKLYSNVIRKYFNITNFDCSINEDTKFFDTEQGKCITSIKQLQVLKNIRKSVIKLNKPSKSTNPHLNMDFIQVNVKNPKNFRKIISNFRDFSINKYTARLSYKHFAPNISVKSVKALNKEIKYGFGIGNSWFYREIDLSTYKAIDKIPTSSTPKDKTLYLSRSTFFNDTGRSLNSKNDLEEFKTISCPSESLVDNCNNFTNEGFIPFADDNYDLTADVLPDINFSTINIPNWVIRTIDFSDRRPYDIIADELGNNVYLKLNPEKD